MRILLLAVVLLFVGCGDDGCGIEGDFCFTRWECCGQLRCVSSMEFTGGKFVVSSECTDTTEE
jgi:hypothetical protein